MIQGWYCEEKLDVSHSWGLKVCNECLNEEINEWTETWNMNKKINKYTDQVEVERIMKR